MSSRSGRRAVADAVAAGRRGLAPVLSATSQERARVCVEAAGLKSRGWSYRRIASHFGWSSPAAAHKAVQLGLSLIPSEDLHSVRRGQALVLDDVVERCYEIIGDPGPLVSQGKIIWRDEGAGDYFPDAMARIRALEALLKASGEIRKLHGADAAKRTMSIVASLPEAEIEAEIARLKAQSGAGADPRELEAGLAGVEDPAVDAVVVAEGDSVGGGGG